MTEPMFEVTMSVTVVRGPDRASERSGPQDHVEVTVRGNDVGKAITSALRSLGPLARRLTSQSPN